jgi:hypothetical protein
MSQDVVAVLVVPADGDPGGLLAMGKLGQRPPCVIDYGRSTDGWQPYAIPTMTTGTGTLALPLWWDGALVPEGWDRARRVWFHTPGRTPLDQGHRFEVSLAQAEMVGLDLVRLGLASRVVRLARVDGRLVEVADG